MKIYNTEGKIISGFVIALLVIGFFSWITYRNMRLTNADSKEVNSSLQILKSVEKVFVGALDIYAGYSDYIITGDENCLIPVNNAIQESGSELKLLMKASAIDADRKFDANSLAQVINAHIEYGEKSVEIRQKQGLNAAIQFVNNDNGIKLMYDIRFYVNKIEDQERKVLALENQVKADRSHKTLVLFVLLGTGVFIFLLLCFVMIRNDSINKKKAGERIAYLANLIEQTSDAIISVDENRIIKTWNRGAEKMYGYTQQEAIGKTTVELLNSNIEVEKLRHFIEQNKSDEKWEIEVVHKKKDQTNIYVSASIGHIKNKEGKVIGLVGVNKDITAQKKLEEQLISFNEHLSAKVQEKTREIENIFNQISESFITLNNSLVFTYVNNNACHFFGKSKDELIGYKATDVFPNIVNMAVYQIALGVFERQVPAKVENFSPLLQKWIQNSIYPHPDGISIFFKDITEERKNREELMASELRYRSLVEQASDAIMLYDRSGKIIDANTGACKMLGFSLEEIIDIKIPQLFFEEDIRQTPLRFKEQLEGKTVLSERRMKRKDQTPVAVEINTRMLTTGLFLGIARDITHRKQSEKELNQMNIRLRELSSHLQTIREEERTNISREIHDELGQQLTALKMDASWIAKKMNGDAMMNEKIMDMISLIDETLKTIRRIAADLRPVVLDDIGLIAALDWYCSEYAKRTGIKCSFHSAVSELHYDQAIAICIFRICQETLTNVARHAQSTYVEVAIDVINETMELNIKDNGRGFDISKIKDKRTLGILGMEERAKMCNGSFYIESKNNKGTIVTLSVPLSTEKVNQVAI